MARKLVNQTQSIGDETPDSNVHEHICYNGEVAHQVKTSYGV